MGEAETVSRMTIAAVPGQVRAARVFVARVLGGSCPLADVAVLLAGQIVVNSVLHSGSVAPGGLVTVTVAVGRGVVRVEVTDRSGESVPVLQRASSDGEGGQGMRLVDALAARWGYQRAAVSPRRGSR